MNARWRIELLGGLRVQTADRVVTRFRSQNIGTLLAYLALHNQHPQPREALIELLWPEIDPEVGRTNFRFALHSLRQELGSADAPPQTVLIVDRQTVQLDPAAFSTDVAELRAAVEAAARTADPTQRAALLTSAVALYRGELLPGRFEPWVLTERQALAEIYLTALQQLAAALEQAGNLEGALEAARRAVAADPLREEAHYELMRLYAATGQPSATVKQYQELERLFREELGETPSATTRALAEELRQSARTVVVARSGRASGRQGEEETRRVPTAPDPGQQPSESHPLTPSPPHPLAPSPPPRLPLQFTRFFGRGEEIARLTEILRIPETRLVTLTGPGGSGKTRLAIAVAGRLQEEFEDSVWFVPLAEVSDGQRLGEALREALGLAPAPGVEALEQMVAALQQRCLLVLDNFEQLAEQGATLVHSLLSRLPDLTCLVTSRQRLDVAGEQEFMVLPLPTPPVRGEERTMTPEELLGYPSIGLFVNRAQAARSSFQLTAANAAAVAALCDRLEGLPLALELAAARAAVLTPEQMLPRLTRRFELLVSHERSRSARHRSLRAAIDWSYQQLPPDLQRFFAGLSVFRGSFDLDAAEAVCEEPEAMACLEQLRQCSLLVAEEAGPAMRYRLLESLRQYGQEQLTPEQQTELSQRHAAFFMQVAEQAEAQWRGDEPQTWVERLEQEPENLRAALEWCLSAEAEPPADPKRSGPDPSPFDRCAPEAIGLRLAAATWWFWPEQGYLGEGRGWLERALAAGDDAPAQLRARLLLGLGWLFLVQGDFSSARAACEQSLALFRSVDDRVGVYRALWRLGGVAYNQQEFAQARSLWEESLALQQELGRKVERVETLRHLWRLASVLEDRSAARAFYEQEQMLMREFGGASAAVAQLISEADRAREQGNPAILRTLCANGLALAREFGNQPEIAYALDYLGETARDLKEYELARALLQQALVINRALGRPINVHLTLYLLSQVTRLAGDLTTARACAEESLQIARAAGSKEPIAHSLDELRLIALRQGDWQTARSLPLESLIIWQELGNHWGLAEALEGVAHLAVAQGEATRGARLLGAAERLRETIGQPHHPHERADYEQSLAAARAALGEAAFAAAWTEGRALSPEQAVALAMQP